MTLSIYQVVKDYLPVKRRTTSKGWIVFNAVCCHHKGHKRDTRSRGNFLQIDRTMITNCYNCGFKAKYTGGDLSSFFEQWMIFLGVPQEKIQSIKLELMRKKLAGELEEAPIGQFVADEFKEVSLPEESFKISELIGTELDSEDFNKCVEYIKNRGSAIETGWDYYWSPLHKWDMNNRVIIPFKDKNKIVGWSARYVGTPPSGISKYFNSDLPTGYLFNGDVIARHNRKYVIIVEGPFDAIAIDGVAALGSKLNSAQIEWLNSTDKEKIVLPDLQKRNQGLIDVALEQHWSVSFPEWSGDIKDAADAQKRYGQLYTLASILSNKTTSELQIGFKRQLLKG